MFNYHFRRFKKKEGAKHNASKHPKLIVDEKSDQYGYMGLTKSRKRGHHNNIPLKKNPQKGNTVQSYIRNELRYDLKSAFEDVLPDYRLSREDADMITKHLLEKRKKK